MSTATGRSVRIIGTDIGRTSVSFPGAYLLMVVPPKSDAGYAALASGTCKEANPPGLPEEYESRAALLEAERSRLEQWRQSYAERDTLPNSPPDGDRTTLAIHPDLQGEVTLRDFFGDATLASFGAGEQSPTRFQEADWYKQTPEYEQWLDPLHDHDDLVLYGIFGRPPVASDLGRHVWVRSNEQGRLEALTRDHATVSGPILVDRTRLVRWLGDYHHTDSTLSRRYYQLEANTPFGRHWSYNALRKFPETVAGWEWHTRERAWVHADGHCKVDLGPGYLDVRDVRAKDMGGRYVAAEWPSEINGTGLSESDVRQLAVEWMREHPAEEWDHPLRPLFDQADEFGGPDGYRPYEGIGRYDYHGRLCENASQRYSRATLRYIFDIDELHQWHCPKLFIVGGYEPGTDPDASENGPWTVKITAGRTARVKADDGCAVEGIQTFSAACQIATERAE